MEKEGTKIKSQSKNPYGLHVMRVSSTLLMTKREMERTTLYPGFWEYVCTILGATARQTACKIAWSCQLLATHLAPAPGHQSATNANAQPRDVNRGHCSSYYRLWLANPSDGAKGAQKRKASPLFVGVNARSGPGENGLAGLVSGRTGFWVLRLRGFGGWERT